MAKETTKPTATVKSTSLKLALANGTGITSVLVVKSVFGNGIDADVMIGVGIAFVTTLVMLLIAAAAGDE